MKSTGSERSFIFCRTGNHLQAPLCVAVNRSALFTMCLTTEPTAVTSLNPHSQRFWRHQNETQRLKPLDFADSKSRPTLLFFPAFISCDSCVSAASSGRRLGREIPPACCLRRRARRLGWASPDDLFMAPIPPRSVLSSARSCLPCWLPRLSPSVGASRAVSRLSG